MSVLNLGGGYKVGRMTGEKSTDLLTVGAPVKTAFEDFAARTVSRSVDFSPVMRPTL